MHGQNLAIATRGRACSNELPPMIWTAGTHITAAGPRHAPNLYGKGHPANLMGKPLEIPAVYGTAEAEISTSSAGFDSHKLLVYILAG